MKAVRDVARALTVALAGLGASFSVSAAQSVETIWSALFFEARIDDGRRVVGDVQFRGADRLERLDTHLWRAGYQWNLAPNQTFTIGAAYIDTFRPGPANLEEFRPWQQWTLRQPLFGVDGLHRLRLEQRHLSPPGSSDFWANRLRYAIRLGNSLPALGDGGRWTVQTESFLNLDRRDRLNAPVLGLQRSNATLGRRISPHVILDVGYLHQYASRTTGEDINTHALFLALNARY